MASYNFDAATLQIINAHKNDFNSKNYSSKIKKYGGYSKYVKGLGGVFERVATRGLSVKTIQEFQDTCVYVSGLMAIWGFDYSNGKTYWHWGSSSSKPASDAFYQSGRHKSNSGTISQLCQGSNGKARTTCCNYGVDTVLKTGGIYKMTTDRFKGLVNKKIATVVRDKTKLKPGDIICFFSNRVTSSSPGSWSGWKHCALVYKVDTSKKQVILADYGSRFIKSKKPFHTMSRDGSSNPGGSYSNYSGWVGLRTKAYASWKNEPAKQLVSTSDTSTTNDQNIAEIEAETIDANNFDETGDAVGTVPVNSEDAELTSVEIPKEVILAAWQTPMKRLKKGSQGKPVKIWQIILNNMDNQTNLKVDGQFGNNTLIATKKFQGMNKYIIPSQDSKNPIEKQLVVDGVVDTEEWEIGLKNFVDK